MQFAVLFCLLFLAPASYAQNPTTLNFPLLKESQKIDSLLDIAINKGNQESFYFCIQIIDIDDSIYTVPRKKLVIGIVQHIYNDGNIHCILPYPTYMYAAGFFKYKGCTIIVFQEKKHEFFFIETPYRKSFNFIWDRNGIDRIPAFRKGFYSDAFSFINGKFSVWGERVGGDVGYRLQPEQK